MSPRLREKKSGLITKLMRKTESQTREKNQKQMEDKEHLTPDQTARDERLMVMTTVVNNDGRQ